MYKTIHPLLEERIRTAKFKPHFGIAASRVDYIQQVVDEVE